MKDWWGVSRNGVMWAVRAQCCSDKLHIIVIGMRRVKAHLYKPFCKNCFINIIIYLVGMLLSPQKPNFSQITQWVLHLSAEVGINHGTRDNVGTFVVWDDRTCVGFTEGALVGFPFVDDQISFSFKLHPLFKVHLPSIPQRTQWVLHLSDVGRWRKWGSFWTPWQKIWGHKWRIHWGLFNKLRFLLHITLHHQLYHVYFQIDCVREDFQYCSPFPSNQNFLLLSRSLDDLQWSPLLAVSPRGLIVVWWW